jgi:alpha-ketoglutarate-dependent taurine dioxygenase
MNITKYYSNAVWKPEDLQKDKSWIYTFNQHEKDELKKALLEFKDWVQANDVNDQVNNGTLLPSPDNFNLPTLKNIFKKAQHDLEEGYGVALFKGCPLDVSEQDARLLFGGIVSYIGTAQPQTLNKELLQPVQDEGQAKLDERRGSKHNMGLPVHNDGCDVVGFLCRRKPLKGGSTILVSAAAVHNKMLEEHPELLAELYKPFYHSWQDYQFLGGVNSEEACNGNNLSRTWHAPIFSLNQKLCVRYSRFYTDRAQTYHNIPKLNEKQIAALDTFDSYINDASEWQYRRDFELGDVMFVNNHELFHTRTEFLNGENINDCRQLYRAWIAVPNSRALNESLACFFGNTAAGSQRGGVKKEFIDNAKKSMN